MKKKKGFTLIELLVVIAVIGMLASIVLVSLGPARKKARDARRQSDIREVNLAMEMCYDDPACNGAESYMGTPGGDVQGLVIATYMTIPDDPLSPTQIYTSTIGTTQYYCIYAALEAEASTWFCASNKGVFKDTGAVAPTNADCCGVDVTSF